MSSSISRQFNELLKMSTEASIRQALELLKKAYKDEDYDEAAKWLEDNDPEEQEDSEESDDKSESAAAKPKRSKRRDWQPPSNLSPQHTEQIAKLMQDGYSQREASRMVGAHSEPYDFATASQSSVKPSKPSSKFLSDIQDLARNYISKTKDLKIKESSPEKNPVLYSRGKMDEAHSSFDEALSAAVNKFKESEDFKNASKFKRSALLSKFKAGWAASPEGMDAAKKFGEGYEAHKDAEKARSEFIQQTGQHMATGGASGLAEHDISSQEAAQHVGGDKSEDGMTQATISKDPLASFASNNPHLVRHIQDTMPKMSERANRLNGAKQFAQPKEEKPKFVVRRREGQ
jgi:hypothetical protein